MHPPTPRTSFESSCRLAFGASEGPKALEGDFADPLHLCQLLDGLEAATLLAHRDDRFGTNLADPRKQFETDESYLYFVARPDGSHIFTKSLEEHNRAREIARSERRAAANR